MNKAVFIDKDGTLIHDVPYNADPAFIELNEGAAKSLKEIKAKGYLLIVVSNQSGIARGLFDEEAIEIVQDAIQQQLNAANIQLDGFYYCPHHPQGSIVKYAINCNCRKPEPGMLLTAAKEFNIDLKKSWMVGDILNDIEAGSKAGCKTILIDNGNETEWQLNSDRVPTVIARTWEDVSSIITKQLVHD